MRLVIVGGSDAGISAALRARECAPEVEVTVLLADAYPNFSICGIPYHVSGEVPDWRSLAHRSMRELTATGMTVLTDTRAVAVVSIACPTTPWWSGPAPCRRCRRSRGSTGSAPPTGCMCCTPWTTRSC